MYRASVPIVRAFGIRRRYQSITTLVTDQPENIEATNPPTGHWQHTFETTWCSSDRKNNFLFRDALIRLIRAEKLEMQGTKELTKAA